MLFLPPLLKGQGIELSCLGKKIDYGNFQPELIRDFLYRDYPDIYLHEIGKYIASTEPTYLTVSGENLERLLAEPQLVSELACFLFGVFWRGTEAEKDIVTYLDVDMEKIHLLDPDYGGFDAATGSRYSKLAPQMSLFEKHWNLCLCQCWLGKGGGYEWPGNAREFDEAFANNACWFLAGKGDQLQRYLPYAQAFKDFKEKIERNVSIFGTRPS